MPEQLRIPLDRSSPVPLYHQVATAIDAAIADGTLAPGEFLENEVALARRLGISRPTARQALQDLVDRGRLVRRRGVGTQVAPPRIHRPVGLTSLHDDLVAAGRTSGTRLLLYRVEEADAQVAEALDVPVGSEVVHLERLRTVDDEPLALLVNRVPATLAPRPDELERTGLYDALRDRGARPKVAHQRIGARGATEPESRLLGEPAHAAVLTMERVAYDATGRAVEYGRHLYRASRHVFETTLFAD